MILEEKRSGIDTRSDAERLLIGERRSGLDRRAGGEPRTDFPSSEHLALFTRRLKRTVRDPKGRTFFGVATGENDFALYPDVVRVIEWLECLSGDNQHGKDQP